MSEGETSSSGIDWSSLSETLNSYHVPEIALILAGVVALAIVYFYLKDKDGMSYKLMMMLGVLMGAVSAVLCATSSLKGNTGTLIIVALGCFALVSRPFRDVKFAVIFALFAMIIAYIFLGNLDGDLEALSKGWPRVIVAFIAGAVVYMLLMFLQDLTLLFAKIFNTWPVLLVLGIICIAEGISIYSGHGSVYDLLKSYLDSNKEIILSVLLT